MSWEQDVWLVQGTALAQQILIANGSYWTHSFIQEATIGDENSEQKWLLVNRLVNQATVHEQRLITVGRKLSWFADWWIKKRICIWKRLNPQHHFSLLYKLSGQVLTSYKGLHSFMARLQSIVHTYIIFHYGIDLIDSLSNPYHKCTKHLAKSKSLNKLTVNTDWKPVCVECLLNACILTDKSI